MSISYIREQITEGINFSSIIDPKFKTNTVRIYFITPLKPETAHSNALAVANLGSSNIKYKTLAELSSKLNDLYGANITVDDSKMVNNQIMVISVNSIANRFALEKEDIQGEALDIVLDCIFNPNIENEGFDKEIFNFRKRDAVESIQAEINDKRIYAILQAQKSIFKNEQSFSPVYHSAEEMGKVTVKETYEAYKEIIKSAQIEIFYVGAEENPIIKEKFAKAFTDVNRKNYNDGFVEFSPLKKEVCEVSETLDVNQTKMVMAFKSPSTDYNAIRVMNSIFGGTAFSKLFSNVREKLSLCYYCASGYKDGKGTLIVDSGVEKENIEKARKEILNQFQQMKDGNFTDEEMENSKLSLLNSYKSVGDTPYSLISWYFKKQCDGDIIAPEEEMKKIQQVTREQIIDSAKSFELDTVYVMTVRED